MAKKMNPFAKYAKKKAGGSMEGPADMKMDKAAMAKMAKKKKK